MDIFFSHLNAWVVDAEILEIEDDIIVLRYESNTGKYTMELVAPVNTVQSYSFTLYEKGKIPLDKEKALLDSIYEDS